MILIKTCYILKKIRAQLYSKAKQYILQISWQVARLAVKDAIMFLNLSRIDIDFTKRDIFEKYILKTQDLKHYKRSTILYICPLCKQYSMNYTKAASGHFFGGIFTSLKFKEVDTVLQMNSHLGK